MNTPSQKQIANKSKFNLSNPPFSFIVAKGVEIHLEQENIQTFSMDSELQLSMMSIMAEGEIIDYDDSF